MALLGSGCVRCGRPYPATGIKVLAQRDEIAFVQLICFNCQVQTLALVTGLDSLASRADGAAADSLSDLAGRTETAWPISVDDVLEMHDFLNGYEGDLRSLLDRTDEPGNGGHGQGGRQP
jgi:hypothetical protein